MTVSSPLGCLVRQMPRFRTARRLLPQLAERESWTREQIQEFQLRKLNEIWAHAIVHVPYYRKLMRRSEMPQQFESLEQFTQSVPLISKNDIQSDRTQFLSERPARGSWKYTGGSTGSPAPYFWETQAHRNVLRAKYRMYERWGVDMLDPMVFLWGHTASFAPGWRGALSRRTQPITDRLRNRTRMSAYRLGQSDLRRHLQEIAKLRPTAIYGYGSAVWMLAREALDCGMTCDSLKAVFTTAEPVCAQRKRLIAEAFQVPAVQEYGSIECGFIAGEQSDKTLRVREDRVLVETLPNQDGRYSIVVTVLDNPSFPLLRYAIGDVTDQSLHHPEQGFAVLGTIFGRSNELLVSKSGRCLHPFWFEDVFENVCGAHRWQVHQCRDGSIEVKIESRRRNESVETQGLAKLIQEHFEGFPVSLQVVESIPSTIGGKHQWIVSDATTHLRPETIPRGALPASRKHHSSIT